MKRNHLIAGVAAVVLAGGAVGATGAFAGGDDGERQATGPGADRARAAALKLVPGGTATAVERDSEKGATWEVEVRRADGSSVDVRLDASYQKVAIDSDSETDDGDR